MILLISKRLEAEFSKPNTSPNNTLANDLASLARYLHSQGLSMVKIAEAIDVEYHTVNKWIHKKYRTTKQETKPRMRYIPVAERKPGEPAWQRRE